MKFDINISSAHIHKKHNTIHTSAVGLAVEGALVGFEVGLAVEGAFVGCKIEVCRKK